MKRYVLLGMIRKIPDKIGVIMLKSSSQTKEKGFTLLEVLFCLSILILLIILAPRLSPFFFQLPSQNQFNKLEWTIFLEQVQIEFREAKSAQALHRKLVLTDRNNDLITHSMSGNRLIRKVNGTGNEILLQNVKAVSYEVFPSKVIIHIEDINNQKHIGLLTRFSPLETGGG
ncbi:competence type IV pilus minor pilin ComGF [Microbacteriaceae bacterium 4G12]